MTLADLGDLLGAHEHALDLGGLVGAAHPTLNAHIGASAAAMTGQGGGQVAQREATRFIAAGQPVSPVPPRQRLHLSQVSDCPRRSTLVLDFAGVECYGLRRDLKAGSRSIWPVKWGHARGWHARSAAAGAGRSSAQGLWFVGVELRLGGADACLE
jgi:hypothetical protein